MKALILVFILSISALAQEPIVGIEVDRLKGHAKQTEFTFTANVITTQPLVSIQWSFTDGHFDEGFIVRHVFRRKGNQQIICRVTDITGAHGFAVVTVRVKKKNKL